jgi:hypothetical protein
MENEAMKTVKLFILSAGAILLTAASERFLVAYNNAQIFALPDPLLGIPLRYSVLMVGIMELIVAVICLSKIRPFLQLGWIAWLSMNYAIWWIGMNGHPQASATGSLTDPLQSSGRLIGYVIKSLPIYFSLGGIGGLIWLWRNDKIKRSDRDASEFFKIPCPACGGRVKFAASSIGRRIPCPHCQAAISLRIPEENLKMSCFFCHEHIEFPAHALGRKIKCPHCKMEIGLRESV